MVLKRTRMYGGRSGFGGLGSLSPDSSRQLDVFWHYLGSLGMDGAQVCILEEANAVCLARRLESHICRVLPSVAASSCRLQLQFFIADKSH